MHPNAHYCELMLLVHFVTEAGSFAILNLNTTLMTGLSGGTCCVMK